jgi:hypothetical protein
MPEFTGRSPYENMSLAELRKWLPNVDVRTTGSRIPQVSGNMSVPFAGGQAFIDGRYQHRPEITPDLSLMLGYRKQF